MACYILNSFVDFVDSCGSVDSVDSCGSVVILFDVDVLGSEALCFQLLTDLLLGQRRVAYKFDEHAHLLIKGAEVFVFSASDDSRGCLAELRAKTGSPFKPCVE